MVFSSLIFLIFFLPLVLGIYYLSPSSIRNWVLLISSFFFYAWGEPIYILLLIVSTTTDFWLGKWIDKQPPASLKRKIYVFTSIFINLAVLGFFKYIDFIIVNVNNAFGTSIGLLELPLPIGISFYTFQSISYIVDVYRGHAAAQQKWVPFATYISLFPQLVAGPIVQYETISKQLTNRKFNEQQFATGIKRFIRGLAKKVLLANNIGLLWEAISASSNSELSTGLAWLGIIAFAFQIYFDFSGYSDMAIGLGLMFGFTFKENFNLPYISRSITEFWRRWHISLGDWFKNYVYIPLGGNRKGLPRQIINICIVWMLTGIWHGASWNFFLWGVYFAIILMLEKSFLLKLLKKGPAFIQHLYAIILILCGWVIFVFEDTQQIAAYYKALFSFNFHSFDELMLYLSQNVILLVVLVVVAISPKWKWTAALASQPIGQVLLWLLHMMMLLLSIAYLVNDSFNPFLYFRF